MTFDRQRILLAVLVLVALVLGWRAVGPNLLSFGDSSGPARFGRTVPGLESDVPDLLALRLDDLELKPAQFSPGRDPFRFEAKPPPPPPPPPKQVAPTPPRPRPQQGRRRANARARAAPKPPPVDVTYLGSFGPDSGKIAVFRDANDIYNVRKGDTLKEHFVVESINYESADLKYVNFPKLPPTRLAAGQ